MEEEHGYEIEALSRGLRVQAIMMEQPEWHTLGQLSRSTGLSRNAVFRILKTFEARGVVAQSNKRWLLTPEFLGRCRLAVLRLHGKNEQPHKEGTVNE